MPMISFTREIKLTNEDALKIFNDQPSEKLQAVLKSIESENFIVSNKNKLISKYLWKKKPTKRLVLSNCKKCFNFWNQF